MTQENHPVLKGAEELYAKGSHIGVLVSHGFTGTTQSMRPLGEALIEAGYTVCIPRLKGHGTHYEDMEKTTYQDWQNSVQEGYEWLKERCDVIFMAGLSMGGTLTLDLVQRHPDLKGLVLINAAIDIPAMEGIKEDVRFLDAIGSDIKKPGVEELAYEKTPVKSIGEINQLMKQVREKLNEVEVPTLILVSEEDHVVPPSNSQDIYDKIKSKDKKLVQLSNSYHVATLDHDQDLIIKETLNFIKDYS